VCQHPHYGAASANFFKEQNVIAFSFISRLNKSILFVRLSGVEKQPIGSARLKIQGLQTQAAILS